MLKIPIIINMVLGGFAGWFFGGDIMSFFAVMFVLVIAYGNGVATGANVYPW